MPATTRSRGCPSPPWRRVVAAFGLLLCIAGPTMADVDTTGSWGLMYPLPFGITGQAGAIFSQSGSSLAVTLDFGGAHTQLLGSIDAARGAFTLSGTTRCSETDSATEMTGTVSPDGTSLTATFRATYPCFLSYAYMTGTHLSPTCGNGIVEPGESCDPGPPPFGDGCCSTTCALRPEFARCEDDGLACTADRCDGAGTCTHQPGNAFDVCRSKGPPCDVAEVCDGVSATCPTDQPTCPAADIDVTGRWRITFSPADPGDPSECSGSTDVDMVMNGTSLVVGPIVDVFFSSHSISIQGYLDPVDRSFNVSELVPCYSFSSAGTGETGQPLAGTCAAHGDSFRGG